MPLHHAAVDGADHRVLDRGAAEGAVLGDDAQLVAVLLGVGGEAVGGERVGDRVQRRRNDRWLVDPGAIAAGHGPAVVGADLLGQRLGPAGRRARRAPAEQRDEHVVVAQRSSRSISGATTR